MCLAIPGKIIAITGDTATVSIEGLEVEAGIAIAEDIAVGDYVVVHAGFILQKMSEDDAEEELEIIRAYAIGPGDK